MKAGARKRYKMVLVEDFIAGFFISFWGHVQTVCNRIYLFHEHFFSFALYSLFWISSSHKNVVFYLKLKKEYFNNVNATHEN